jgi:Tfp pilus assembly protein PilP
MGIAKISFTHLIIAFLFWITIPSFTIAADQKSTPTKEDKERATLGDFVYNPANRRDPFVPSYLLKIKQRKGMNIQKTGYELEELRLVGILKTDKVKCIMMEDMQGRGINFKKGDYINTDLWVIDILDDRAILGYKLKRGTRRIELSIPKNNSSILQEKR